MGKQRLAPICQQLMSQFGRAPGTPAALIDNGTTPQQCVVGGTLANISARAEADRHGLRRVLLSRRSGSSDLADKLGVV